MEQILKDINNPFDIEGFENLIKILVTSSTGRDFYSKVVTYYQDRIIDGEGGYAKIVPDEFINSNNIGHWEKVEYFSNFFTTEHRIYINSSLESTKLLVEMFINECMNENIPFELKYATQANERTDGIVIGSNTRVYKKHIDILRKIAKENPQLISQCGTPNLLASRLDGWMGLSDENVSDRSISYTESRIGLILAACTKYLLKHPELENQIEGYNKMYKSYQSFCRTEENSADRKIEKGKLSTLQREQFIRKAITENLADILLESEFRVNYEDFGKVIDKDSDEVIREIYQIFLENCEILGINPNMPTQYDTSQSDLLQVEEIETTDRRSDLENKNYIDLINEYLANSDDELKVHELISVLRTLDEKMLSEVLLMGESLQDANLLNNDGDNIIGRKLEELCRSYIRDGKNSKKEVRIEGKIDASRRGLDSTTLETIKEKNFIYFSQPLEPIENMQKSLTILQAMREKHNTASPQLKNRNLETKIEFLEFMVEHYDEIAEYFLQISTKLESLSKEEIEDLTKKFFVEERPTEVHFRRTLKKRRIAEGVASGISVERNKKITRK